MFEISWVNKIKNAKTFTKARLLSVKVGGFECLHWHIDHQNRIKQIKFYMSSFEYIFQSDAMQTTRKRNDTQMKNGIA